MSTPAGTTTGPSHRRIVIVGGGISGLVAAWVLSRTDQARDPASRGVTTSVTVLEPAARLGGKLQTDDFAGRRVDLAADAFLNRVPWARQLCTELGIEEQLVAPVQRDAWLWTRGVLRRFPSDTVLGVPSDLTTVAKSEILTSSGLARAYLDKVLPRARRSPEEDRSIGEVVGRRLGREVVERLVDPLVGGINGGNVDRLSLRSAAPQIAALASGASLVRAAHERISRQDPEASAAPVFLAPKGGMHTLVEALVAGLDERGVALRTGTAAHRLERRADGWSLTLIDGERVETDAVVLATPAFVTARLVREVLPAAAAVLDDIEYASVSMVRLAYRARDVGRPLDGSGFVVPAVDGHLLTGCSWASSKWEALRSTDQVIVRASAGRIGDRRADELDDDELAAALHRELSGPMVIGGPPHEVSVARWDRSFPQYEPGHRERILAVERAARDVPGLAITGAAHHGIGIPACIHSATEAATALLGRLATAPSSR